MGKTVKHFCILTDPLYGKAVVFLIQEKSGLLSVLNVHNITDAVFRNLHFCIKRLSDKSRPKLHSLFGTLFRIASLIDSPDRHVMLGQNFFQDL